MRYEHFNMNVNLRFVLIQFSSAMVRSDGIVYSLAFDRQNVNVFAFEAYKESKRRRSMLMVTARHHDC